MSTAPATAAYYNAMVVKVKRLLLRSEAGVNGIRSLSRALGISDDCGGDSSTTKEAFTGALRASQVAISEKEVAVVFSVLDRGGAGTIDAAEFIAALRCDLSPLRRVWLARAWEAFERKNAQGCVAIADMRAAFRPERHPDVLKGRRSADEVEEEFAATFNESTNPDGAVSQQEFEEYYSGVSGAYCDDEGFTALLRGVWPMPGVSDAFTSSLVAGTDVICKTFSAHQTAAEKKGISHVKKMEAEMLRVIAQEHRPKAMESGVAAREIGRSLRAACLAGMFATSEDFTTALRQCRLYIATPDAVAALDTNGDGTVDVRLYLALLLLPVPPARRLMLERLWQRVFPVKDEANRVDVRHFQSKYMATRGEDRHAFLSAWDVREAADGTVSLDEFIEWCTPMSARVQLDKDFEALLCREWKGFALDEQRSVPSA